MNIEEIRHYCLAKKGTTESFPFDETTLVFKVMNKMYALLSLSVPHSMNLKCDPERAIELREEYEEIKAGYHMNKKHWNTIIIDGLSLKQMQKWIDHSYQLVWDKLPRKIKN